MSWLQQHNPAMRWFNLLRRLCEGNEATLLKHIALIDADPFHFIESCERPTIFSIQAIALHHPDTNQHNNEVLAATTVSNIPCVYKKYARVFNKVAAYKLWEHGPQDHTIDLAGTKTPPFGPLYNLLTNELKAFQDYVSNNPAKGFIQQLTLLAGAPILFVKKEEGTLCLCINYKGMNCIITRTNTQCHSAWRPWTAFQASRSTLR